ncbi:NAD kinase [Weissella coleopterorum]|uniref:NAD kinase n=1 Tax=Weissella coleopterorum TaxID=2714949 RepID=A0A6G8AZL4_9LACO|nr:NAD kinase [Weissella coleopterorum]QIL50427.1 NAD kinase [Weissella coleopterorum]
MRISIYQNKSARSQKVSDNLKILLSEHAERFIFDDVNPEVVISIGGDGTLLSAFQQYLDQIDQLRFVGVHTGHLGFYADWQEFELAELVESLLAAQPQTIQYPLLESLVKYRNGTQKRILSMNEAALKQISGTLAADVLIDGELFERFRGDGLTAATPTGSTAYNKAIGGAVMNPSLASIQLSEIASINNRVFRTLGSPLVVGPEEVIRIVPFNVDNEIILSHDHLNETTDQIEWIEFRVAKEQVSFASYRHTPFWRRVRNSFIGDEVVD